MGMAVIQGAWLMGTEMGQSWVEAPEGTLKAGKWEGVP